MENDVELMRELLFELEARQTSPRMVVILSLDEEATALGCTSVDLEAGLMNLLDLDYIDGPGMEDAGVFLFRKLTRKGLEFVKRTRRPRDWETMKRHFAQRRIEDGA